MAVSAWEPAEIARRLLDQEIVDLDDPIQVARAGERVCHKLHGQVAPLIGSIGFRSVLGYALRRAAVQFSLLKEVEIGVGDDPWLRGLAEKAGGSDPAELRGALVALFTSFLDLLDGLLGQGLSRSLLRGILPDL